MNKTLKIALSEFKSIFYSPIAWLALGVFVAQTAFSFLNVVEICKMNISTGIAYSRLTSEVFSGNGGLFGTVRDNLYLYMPLLTMGLMSREISSGSIKLLFSSPVTSRQIIFGKYLAIMLYGLLLILVLLVYCIMGHFMIKSMDTGLILPGLLAIYLLICAYAAIGLFLSSLTSHLVVAAVGTLAVFAGLKFIGVGGQNAYTVTTGLLVSTDMICFLLLIAAFIFFSIFKLDAERTFKSTAYVAGKYLLLLLVVAALGYLSSLPQFTFYKDMTATQALTLTKSSQDVIKQLKGPLKVTTYVNLLNANAGLGLSGNRSRDRAQLLDYERLIPGFEHQYVYYYDYSSLSSAKKIIDKPEDDLKAGAEKLAEVLDVDIDQFMPPSEIRKRIDLREEDNRLIRELSYNGKKTFLRFYSDMQIYPYEEQITAAIKRLVTEAPKVAFVVGDNERSIDKLGDRHYNALQLKDFRSSLVNNGFEVMNVNLHEGEIPDGLSALVLADPTVELGKAVEDKISSYLRDGGNMFIAGEPGRQALINPILKPLGVQLKEGHLINPGQDNVPELLFTGLDPKSVGLDSTLAADGDQQKKMVFPNAAALTLTPQMPYDITPIVSSPSTGGVLEKAVYTKGVFPVVLGLRKTIGGKEQRIIVSGDADFISTAGLQREEVRNFALMTWIFKWFSYGEFPIAADRPMAPDNQILTSKVGISMLKLLLVWILPGLIWLSGGIFLLRRTMDLR